MELGKATSCKITKHAGHSSSPLLTSKMEEIKTDSVEPQHFSPVPQERQTVSMWGSNAPRPPSHEYFPVSTTASENNLSEIQTNQWNEENAKNEVVPNSDSDSQHHHQNHHSNHHNSRVVMVL